MPAPCDHVNSPAKKTIACKRKFSLNCAYSRFIDCAVISFTRANCLKHFPMCYIVRHQWVSLLHLSWCVANIINRAGLTYLPLNASFVLREEGKLRSLLLGWAVAISWLDQCVRGSGKSPPLSLASYVITFCHLAVLTSSRYLYSPTHEYILINVQFIVWVERKKIGNSSSQLQSTWYVPSRSTRDESASVTYLITLNPTEF